MNMADDKYVSFLGIPGINYQTKLRQYEGFVRERLAGCTITDPLDAHLAFSGTLDDFDERTCRAITGLLLIFNYEPHPDGVYLRKEVWPEDKQAVGRRYRRASIERLYFGNKPGKQK
jgi:hypothetical protein